MVDALVEDVGINEGLVGEMMGGRMVPAELGLPRGLVRRSGSLGYCSMGF